MKCPFCGYVSFDHLAACKQCGAELPLRAAVAAGVDAVPRPAAAGLPEELFSLRLDAEAPSARPPRILRAGARRRPEERAAGPALSTACRMARSDELATDLEVTAEDLLAAEQRSADESGPDFNLDDDLVPPALPGLEEEGIAVLSPPWRPELRDDAESMPSGEAPPAWRPDPIIDRDEEVPERFWTMEGAGLGRRIAAVALDQVLIALALGLFFGGACLSFRISGFDPALFLAPAGLTAALLPFVLLALLLNLGYFTFFHGWQGRTPGKGLVGIEVRRIDGNELSYGRASLRWIGGLLSLVCAGAGFVWAIFEPRRRGWADLLSGTVLMDRSHRPA